MAVGMSGGSIVAEPCVFERTLRGKSGRDVLTRRSSKLTAVIPSRARVSHLPC